MRAADGGRSLRRDAEETFRASPAFRCGISDARPHITFGFQTIKSGVDGADGYLTLRALFDLPSDRNAVCLVSQTQNTKKHDVLEFSQIIMPRHFIYIIE